MPATDTTWMRFAPEMLRERKIRTRRRRAIRSSRCLSTETVVTDPGGAALFNVQPIGFDESLRKAVRAEQL